MTSETIPSFEKYIEVLYKSSKLDKNSIENIINTQLALVFSDLAVKSESDCFLGKVVFEDGVLKLHANDLINEILNGRIDPALILKEIITND